MAIWFKIRNGKLEAFNMEKWWMLKKIWYTITFRKYEIKYMYKMECEVNDSAILKIGDVFVAGTERPPIYFQVVSKHGFKNIVAVSINHGNKPTIENLGGLSVVVKSKS
jgi:hypothetical protein